MKTQITITIESDVKPSITINTDKVSVNSTKVKTKRVKKTAEEQKEAKTEYARQYFQNNKQKIYDKIRDYQATYHRERRHNDPLFAWAGKQRSQLSTMLKAKRNTYYTEVGCTPEQLRQHIESQFTGDMGWHNFGILYELDHIIPLSSATEETKAMITHYTNVRPISIKENRRKHAKQI